MAARREDTSTDLQQLCPTAGDLCARSLIEVAQPTSVATATTIPMKNTRVMEAEGALIFTRISSRQVTMGTVTDQAIRHSENVGWDRSNFHSLGASGLGRDWAQRKPIVGDR